MRIHIAAPLIGSIRESALASTPEECCGILIGSIAGEDHHVDRVVAARNTWDGDRTRRYEIDSQTAFDAIREATAAGRSVVGFYHSHPDGSDQPSSHDLETAWPRMSYVIVTVREGAVTAVRSWRLDRHGRALVEERTD